MEHIGSAFEISDCLIDKLESLAANFLVPSNVENRLRKLLFIYFFFIMLRFLIIYSQNKKKEDGFICSLVVLYDTN